MMTHGGQRAGAGRKLGARALVTRATAEAILAMVNEERIWKRLLRSSNDRIVLDTMKYLTDRRDGKAVQVINGNVSLEGFSEMPKKARERGNAVKSHQEYNSHVEKPSIT